MNENSWSGSLSFYISVIHVKFLSGFLGRNLSMDDDCKLFFLMIRYKYIRKATPADLCKIFWPVRPHFNIQVLDSE